MNCFETLLSNASCAATPWWPSPRSAPRSTRRGWTGSSRSWTARRRRTVAWRQGRTLLHFSAHPEPFLTHKNTLHTLNAPKHPLNMGCTTPTRTPYPIKSSQVELKRDECKPLRGGGGRGRRARRRRAGGRQHRRRRRRPAQVRAHRGRGLHSSFSRLKVSTSCGIRWVPSLDRRVITRHKLNTKRLTDQNGLSLAETWASASPCIEEDAQGLRVEIAALHSAQGQSEENRVGALVTANKESEAGAYTRPLLTST